VLGLIVNLLGLDLCAGLWLSEQCTTGSWKQAHKWKPKATTKLP
jgi:hypothetical protein